MKREKWLIEFIDGRVWGQIFAVKHEFVVDDDAKTSSLFLYPDFAPIKMIVDMNTVRSFRWFHDESAPHAAT